MSEHIGPASAVVASVQYGILSADDVDRLSAVTITSTDINNHGVVEQDGVNSAKTGPSSRQVICSTCGCTLTDCPGHFGKIELADPVINVEYLKMVDNVLNCVCWCCSRLLISRDHPKYESIMNITNLHDRLDAIVYMCKKNRRCISHQEKLALATIVSRKRKRPDGTGAPRCKAPRRAKQSVERVNRDQHVDATIQAITDREAAMGKGLAQDLLGGFDYCGAVQPEYTIDDVSIRGVIEGRLLSTTDILEILQGITDENIRLLTFNPVVARPADMIWQNLPVPPVCMRPARSKSHMSAKIGGEDDLTFRLRSIVRINNSYRAVRDRCVAEEAELERLRAAHVKMDTRQRCQCLLDGIKTSPDAVAQDMNVIAEMVELAMAGTDKSLDMLTCLTQGTITFLRAHEMFNKRMYKTKVPVKPTTNSLVKEIQVVALRVERDRAYLGLQQVVASYQDKSHASGKKDGVGFSAYGRDRDCLRNLIMGKKKSAKNGLLRMGMMGKRVNFAARTVIVPDNSLDADEVGVPIHMCKTMTYPDRVFRWNIHKLDRLVRNGPDMYPGANYILRGDTVISLRFVDRRTIVLQFGDIVERHLNRDDWVFFNRQPSLHKFSMMAHKVVPIPGKAFGKNLLTTTPYNADFDGDEMNIHVARDEMTRAEAMMLFAVDKNIVKDKKPIVCFVQHSILGAYLLTDKDMRIPLYDAHQMLYQNNYIDFNRIPMEATGSDGCVSGRDVFAACLPEGTHVEYDDLRIGSDGYTEGQLTNNKLNNGVVHAIQKDFGGRVACKFMSGTQRMLEYFLSQHGITIALDDYDAGLSDEVRAKVKMAMDYVDEVSIRGKAIGEPHHHPADASAQAVESNICRVLDKSRDIVGDHIENVIRNRKRLNGCVTCAVSGSKGNTANINQAMGIIGAQRNYKSRRICELTSHSKVDDRKDLALAHGFIDESFYSGMRSTQYFFHLACTMDGLVDTAVKTAETGGTQRRLAKAMENITIKSNMVVRDASNNIIQYRYCDDGFDPIEVEDNTIRFLDIPDADLDKRYSVPYDDVAASLSPEAKLRWVNQRGTYDQMMCAELKGLRDMRKKLARQMNGIAMHNEVLCPVKFRRILHRASTKVSTPRDSRDVTPLEMSMATYDLAKLITTRHRSDRLEALFMDWCGTATLWTEFHLDGAAVTWMLNEVESIFGTRVAIAHQSVGCCAAQNSVQPFTQLALNRFHISGQFSELPMGLSKFKEIINATQSPAVPSMHIHLKDHDIMTDQQFEFAARKLHHVLAVDVVTYWDNLVTDVQRWTACRDAAKLVHAQDHSAKPNKSKRSKRSKPPVPDSSSLEFEAENHLVFHMDKAQCTDKMVTPRMFAEALRTSTMRKKKEYTELFDDCLSFSAAAVDDWWVCLSLSDSCLIWQDSLENITNKSRNTRPTQSLVLMYLYEKLTAGLVVRGCPDLAGYYIDKKSTRLLEEDGTTRTIDRRVIVTNGSNMDHILALPQVDAERTVSTNVMDMYETFGIDAARECIESELRGVMSGSKAHVGDRHLTLISDAMCFRGFITPMTYGGTCREETSVLMKAVFEKTMMSFITGAARGHTDTMNTMSEAVAWNGKIQCGTGCVTVFNNQHETDGQENAAGHDVEFMSRPVLATPIMDFDAIFDPPTNRTAVQVATLPHTTSNPPTSNPSEPTVSRHQPNPVVRETTTKKTTFTFKPTNAKYFVPFEGVL